MPKEKYGIKIAFPEPFLQRDLERAFEEIRAQGGSQPNETIAAYRKTVVKAAARLGWISGVDPEKLDEMHPGVLRWAAESVTDFLTDIQQPPAEK